MQVRDYMTKNVLTIGKGEPIRSAWLMMEKHNIRHLPVVEEHKLVGIVSEKDLYKALPSITEIKDTKKLANTLDTVKVENVMTQKVKVVTPEMLIRQAANLFIENKLGCFPVVSGGKLVGILTTTDLLRYIVKERPPEKDTIG